MFCTKLLLFFVYLKGLIHTSQSPSEQSLDWKKENTQDMSPGQHIANADSHSFTYGQLRVISLLDFYVWYVEGNPHEHRRQRQKNTENKICLAVSASASLCCLLLQLLFMKWENVIKIKLHKWLIWVVHLFSISLCHCGSQNATIWRNEVCPFVCIITLNS